MSDSVNAAQAQVDQAWSEHETVRGPVRAQLLDIMRSLEGVTGLQAGPGAERLTDAMLLFGELHSSELDEMRSHRSEAMAAQAARDSAIAAEPPEEAPAPPSLLETSDPLAVREWLKSANDAQVLDVLNSVPERDAQLSWAHQLMTWGRADGNVAQVFAAINTVLTPANPAEIPAGGTSGGTGATSSYRGAEQIPPEASADDTPTAREDASDAMPDGDLEAIESWINHGADATLDLGRARQAYDVESAKDHPRNDVLMRLVEILDDAKVETAPPAEPAPGGEPAPENADATVLLDTTATSETPPA